LSNASSNTSGVAERYATAIFELSREKGDLDTLENDVATLDQALASSEDLRHLIDSPIYSRDATGQAIGKVAEGLGLAGATANALRLMASKRRLGVLPGVLAGLKEMIAEEKGEVSADVRSATPLSDEQHAKLAETLKRQVGRDVKMNVAVDESLIGGLVVKLGSRMIDTSIATKLARLRNSMREVG
jgi:F-type H+-transporting ATPase subunit delta